MVVACVDGSARSVDALVWAIKYALAEGCGLLVLTAWPLGRRPFVREVPGHFNEARWEAQEAQARTLAHARSMVDAVPPIETELVNANALDAILATAENGNLVVLGTDRLTDDAPPSAGSTSLTARVERRSSAPVVLIPASDPRARSQPTGSTEPRPTAGRSATPTGPGSRRPKPLTPTETTS